MYSDGGSSQILDTETCHVVGCPLIASCYDLKEEIKFLGCCKKCNPFIFFLINHIEEQFVLKTLLWM